MVYSLNYVSLNSCHKNYIRLFIGSLLLIIMAFFSYAHILKIIPLYIIFLFVFLFWLLAEKKLDLILSYDEFIAFVFFILFMFFLLIQFFIFNKISLLLGLASFISGLGIVIAFRNGLRSSGEIIFIVNLYLIIHFIVGVIAILQAFTGHFFLFNNIPNSSHAGLWIRPSGVEGMTYNFAKNYIFPIIFTFLALKHKLYNYSKTFSKNYLKFLLIFYLFILILSKTRSTQLTILILFMGYIIYKYKLYTLKYILFAILLFLVVSLIIMLNLKYFLDTSSYTRFVLWFAGYKMFLDHPFIGVGYGLFGDYYNNYIELIPFIGDNYDHRVKAPHSLFIGLISETGIIGTFLIVSFFIKY
jgi:hypothetical protein